MKKLRLATAVILALLLVAVAALAVGCSGKVKVTFRDGDKDVATVKVKQGEALAEDQIPAAPSGHDGEVFDGWYVQSTKVSAGYKPTADVVATAKWSPAVRSTNYTVNLFLADVDDVYPEQPSKQVTGSATLGGRFTYTPSEPHYELDTSRADNRTSTEALGENEVFNVYLRRVTFVLNYDVNLPDVDSVMPADTDSVYGQSLTVGDNGFSVPDSFRFAGWTLSAGGEDVEYAPGETFATEGLDADEATLYAVWEVAYTDFFFGNDYLFVSKTKPNTVYLRRAGLEEKEGTYDPTTNEFAFKDGDKTVLEGLAYNGKFYYYQDLSGKTFQNALDANETIRFDGKNSVTYGYTPQEGEPVTASGTYRLDYVTGEYLFNSDSVEGFSFTVSVQNSAEGAKYLFYKPTGAERGFYSYSGASGTSVLFLDGMMDSSEMGGAVGYSVVEGKLTAVYKAYYYMLTEEEYGFDTPTYRVVNNSGDELFLVRITTSSGIADIDGQHIVGSFRLSDGYDGGYYRDIMDEESVDMLLDGFGVGKYRPAKEDGTSDPDAKMVQGTYTIKSSSIKVDSDSRGVYDWSEEWIEFTPSSSPDPICLAVSSFYYYLLFEEMPYTPHMENWGNSAKKVYGEYASDDTVFYYSANGSVYIFSYEFNAAQQANVYTELDVGTVTPVPGETGLFRFDSGFYTDVNSFFEFRYVRGTVETTVAGASNYEITDAQGNTVMSVDKWGTLTYDGKSYSFDKWSREFIYEIDDNFLLEQYTFEGGSVTVRTDLERDDEGLVSETNHTILSDGALLPLVLRMWAGQEDSFDLMYFVDDNTAAIAISSNDGSKVVVFYGTYVSAQDGNYTFTITNRESYADKMDEDLLATYLAAYGSFVYKIDDFNGSRSVIAAIYDGATSFSNTNGDTLTINDSYGSATFTPQGGVALGGTYERLDSNGTLLRFVTEAGDEYHFRLRASGAMGPTFDVITSKEVGAHYLSLNGYVYSVDYIVLFGDATDSTPGTAFYGDEYGRYRATGRNINYWMMATVDGSMWTEYELTFGTNVFRVICGKIELLDGNVVRCYIDEMDKQVGTFTDDAGGRIEADGYNVVYYASSGITFYGEYGIGFVHDDSPVVEDYRWQDDFEKGEQFIFKAEYMLTGGEVYQLMDSFLFDLDKTDRTKLIVRDQYNATYAQYVQGSVSKELLYLDGHGNAKRIGENGNVLYSGTYAWNEELECMVFNGEDGADSFFFTLAQYTFLRDEYYIFYITADDHVYVNDDWSVLSLGDLRQHTYEDGYEGFINGVYVEADGSAHYGYYSFVAEDVVSFELEDGDKLFFDVTDNTFTPNSEQFIVRTVDGRRVLVGYNGSREIFDLVIPSDVVEIANGVFANFIRVGGSRFDDEGKVETAKFDLANVEVIGDYAFYNVNNFGATEISSEHVTRVGNYAFYSEMAVYDAFGNQNHFYSYINEVNLPNATYIGDYAFFGCNQMNLGTTKLNKVEYIGNFAFTHNYFNSGEVMTLDLRDADVAKIDMQRNAFFPGENTTNWEQNGWPVRILVKDIESYLATTGWYVEIAKKVVVPKSADNSAVLNTVFYSFEDMSLLRLEGTNKNGAYGVNRYTNGEYAYGVTQNVATYLVDDNNNVFIMWQVKAPAGSTEEDKIEYVKVTPEDTTLTFGGKTYLRAGVTHNVKAQQNGEKDFSFRFDVKVEYLEALNGYNVDVRFAEATFDGHTDNDPYYSNQELTMEYVGEGDVYYKTVVNMTDFSAQTDEYGVVVHSADKQWRAVFSNLLEGSSDFYTRLDLYKLENGAYKVVGEGFRRNSNDPNNIFYSGTVVDGEKSTEYKVYYTAKTATAAATLCVEENVSFIKTVSTTDGKYTATFTYADGDDSVMLYLTKLVENVVYNDAGDTYPSPIFEAISGMQPIGSTSQNVFEVTKNNGVGVSTWVVTYSNGGITVQFKTQSYVILETAHDDGENYYEVKVLVDGDNNVLSVEEIVEREYDAVFSSYTSFTIGIPATATRVGDTYTFEYGNARYVVSITKTNSGLQASVEVTDL